MQQWDLRFYDLLWHLETFGTNCAKGITTLPSREQLHEGEGRESEIVDVLDLKIQWRQLFYLLKIYISYPYM